MRHCFKSEPNAYRLTWLCAASYYNNSGDNVDGDEVKQGKLISFSFFWAGLYSQRWTEYHVIQFIRVCERVHMVDNYLREEKAKCEEQKILIQKISEARNERHRCEWNRLVKIVTAIRINT